MASLVSDDDTFIWSALVSHYGLPATPEWGSWMLAELRSQKRIHALSGFGYEGVAITGTRKQLLALLSRLLNLLELARTIHSAMCTAKQDLPWDTRQALRVLPNKRST